MIERDLGQNNPDPNRSASSKTGVDASLNTPDVGLEEDDASQIELHNANIDCEFQFGKTLDARPLPSAADLQVMPVFLALLADVESNRNDPSHGILAKRFGIKSLYGFYEDICPLIETAVARYNMQPSRVVVAGG